MRTIEKLQKSKNENSKKKIGLQSILKKRNHKNDEDVNLISFDDLKEAESPFIYKSVQELEFAEKEAGSSRREKKHAKQLATPETQAQATTERSRSRTKKTKNVMENPLDFEEILQCSSIKTQSNKEILAQIDNINDDEELYITFNDISDALVDGEVSWEDMKFNSSHLNSIIENDYLKE